MEFNLKFGGRYIHHLHYSTHILPFLRLLLSHVLLFMQILYCLIQYNLEFFDF